MKLPANKTLAAALMVLAAGLAHATCAETNLLETLRPSTKQAMAEFERIPPARRNELTILPPKREPTTSGIIKSPAKCFI